MDSAAAKIIAGAIIQASKPGWPLYLSAISSLALALIAVLGFRYARRQLGTSGEQAAAAIEQAKAAQEQVIAAKQHVDAAKMQIEGAGKHLELIKAELLLTVDQMFQQIADSRSLLTDLRKEVEAHIQQTMGHLSEEHRKEGRRLEYASRLRIMREKRLEDYRSIHKIAEFLETVGLYVEREYLILDDIVDLYGGGILLAAEAFEEHIKKEQERLTLQPGFFENFLNLAQKIRSVPSKPSS